VPGLAARASEEGGEHEIPQVGQDGPASLRRGDRDLAAGWRVGVALHPAGGGPAAGRARDLGVNLVDTAECYGDHQAEALIGQAIQRHRDDWVVATKFGHHFHPDATARDRWSPVAVRSDHWTPKEVLTQLRRRCGPFPSTASTSTRHILARMRSSTKMTCGKRSTSRSPRARWAT
jgi:hypothetical protein